MVSNAEKRGREKERDEGKKTKDLPAMIMPTGSATKQKSSENPTPAGNKKKGRASAKHHKKHNPPLIIPSPLYTVTTRTEPHRHSTSTPSYQSSASTKVLTTVLHNVS